MRKKIDTRPKAPFWHDESYEMAKGDKAKLAMYLRARDRELDQEHMYNITNVCPNCHLTLPISGECDECGYKADHIQLTFKNPRRVRASNGSVHYEEKVSVKKTEALALYDEVKKLMDQGIPMEEAIQRVMGL